MIAGERWMTKKDLELLCLKLGMPEPKWPMVNKEKLLTKTDSAPWNRRDAI